MNIIVLLKMVPDVVEELEVSSDGKGLATEWLRLIVSEPDEHALEQGLLIKEKTGGKVTLVATGGPEVDDVLFTGLAKGADRAVKVATEAAGAGSAAMAWVIVSALKTVAGELSANTLILTGSQAIDDVDGEVGAYLSEALGLPYVSVVTGVQADEGGGLRVIKEFAGGLRGEFTVPLPAVLGIQAAEKPPRYVPVAKVRATMQSAKIETLDGVPSESAAHLQIDRMFKPEAAGRAELLEGAPEEVAARIVDVLKERGLL
jgi:electron transfer flavoprotein beta subunit